MTSVDMTENGVVRFVEKKEEKSESGQASVNQKNLHRQCLLVSEGGKDIA